jgi:hypothetical protein
MRVDVWTVTLAALVTALATGLGALPLRWMRGASRRSLGISNAVAAGFMALNPDGDVTALVRADGEVLVRTPGIPHPLPQIPEGSPLRRAAAAGELRGSFTGRTLGIAPDRAGQGRLIAYRRVGDLPLYVTVARPTSLIVARWRQALAWQLAVGVPTALALTALAWLALRRARAAEAAELALREAAAARAAAEAGATPRRASAASSRAARWAWRFSTSPPARPCWPTTACSR